MAEGRSATKKPMPGVVVIRPSARRAAVTLRTLADDPRGDELRFLAARLSEALADALRVAESRGQRLRSRLG